MRDDNNEVESAKLMISEAQMEVRYDHVKYLVIKLPAPNGYWQHAVIPELLWKCYTR